MPGDLFERRMARNKARSEAFKKQQKKIVKRQERKLNIEYLKKARKKPYTNITLKKKKKRKKGKNMGKKKKKRQVGIRNIKGVEFVRGKKFFTRRKDAEYSKKVFSERGHLARIFPAKKDKKKGYYSYHSEERIKSKRW